MTGDVSVRMATVADAYALWLWANDEETRRASHGRDPIGWAAHRAWLEARLADPLAALMIGVDAEDRPIGSVRFDTADGWRSARLSYVVASEARGRGLGRPLVEAGVRRLRAAVPELRVYADVLRSNERSARVFRALGWTEHEQSDGALRFWSA